MFNLEQSIAEWRWQMRAAGIKTPVPLEELENHLREEIERQMRVGTDSEQAFKTAVQKIGPAGDLKSEFKKVDAARKERDRAVERKVIFITLHILIILIPLAISSMVLFKFGDLSQITSGQQISGLAATATFTLLVLCGRLAYRLFPLSRTKRTKDVLGGVLGVLVMLWSILFFHLVLPHYDFTLCPLFVVILWGLLAPLGVVLGWVSGTETAARKRGAMAVS